MSLTPCRCPQCGAELSYDAEQTTIVCSYCNTQFVVDAPAAPAEQSTPEKNKKASFLQTREDSPADRLPLDLIDNIGTA